MSGALLEATGVVRRFRGGAGVGPVDLSIRAGEVLALMGPNGSGKSTLLRVLASADRPQAGRVEWWGSSNRRLARRQLGYAPDEPVDEPTLSPRQSTHFWCRQWIDDDGESRRRTDAALSILGLGAVADEPLQNLSFGTRRRLGLAQAMVHGPALLLLDEPTAGLDPDGVDDLCRVLAGRSQRGEAAAVASNDPAFIERVAHTVVFLDGGRLIRTGTPAELMATLPSHRLAELRRREGAESMREVPGARLMASADGWIGYELRDGSVLPALVAAADSPGGQLVSLRVRQPDLRDCFRLLTGRDLEAPG